MLLLFIIFILFATATQYYFVFKQKEIKLLNYFTCIVIAIYVIYLNYLQFEFASKHDYEYLVKRIGPQLKVFSNILYVSILLNVMPVIIKKFKELKI